MCSGGLETTCQIDCILIGHALMKGGIPQGSALSPLLVYTVSVIYVSSQVTNGLLLQYADRLKYIMLLKLPIVLSGNSFNKSFLPYVL